MRTSESNGNFRSTMNQPAALARVRHEIQKQPYQMVLLTFSLGYLLGGGLFSRATYRLAGTLMAALQVPYIRMRLLSYLEGAVGQAIDSDVGEESHSGVSSVQQ